MSMSRAKQQAVSMSRSQQQTVEGGEEGTSKPTQDGKWHDEVAEFVILAKTDQRRMMTASPSTTHNNSKTTKMKVAYAYLDYRSVLYCTNDSENENLVELEDDGKAREAGITDTAMPNCVAQPTNKDEDENRD